MIVQKKENDEALHQGGGDEDGEERHDSYGIVRTGYKLD